MLPQTNLIYQFSKQNDIDGWQIVNDGVMGGLSQSQISLNEDGHGKFEGHISLANNGGFASVRLLTDIELDPNNKYIVLKVKGDGKPYQFRLKSSKSQRQSYVQEYQTTGDWQSIKLEIDKFSPQYRGRSLDLPNFEFSEIEEIRILIGNKKEQDFKLLIDSIELE